MNNSVTTTAKLYVAPIVVAVLVGWMPSWFNRTTTPQERELELLRTLSVDLTSTDFGRNDAALDLLKENLPPERFGRYQNLVRNRVQRRIELLWRPTHELTSDDRRTQLGMVESFQRVRPEWAGFVRGNMDRFRRREEQRLNDSKNKEAKKHGEGYAKLVDSATEKMRGGDCVGAFGNYMRISDAYPDSRAAESGMILSSNCVRHQQWAQLAKLIDQRTDLQPTRLPAANNDAPKEVEKKEGKGAKAKAKS